MAWTTPFTPVPLGLMTASLWNVQVRDNLNILKTSISDDGGTWSGEVDTGGTVQCHNLNAVVVSGSEIYGDFIGCIAEATGGIHVAVRNTAAGAGNYAAVIMGNNAVEGLGGLYAMASNWTPSAYHFPNGIALVSTGAGGLSLVSTDAGGDVRLYTYGVERMRIFEDGGIAIGNASVEPGAGSLHVGGDTILMGNPFDPGIRLTASSIENSLIMASGAFGTGFVRGAAVHIGRNTSGGGAAGVLDMITKDGGISDMWFDVSGILRRSFGGPPNENGTPADTSGTPVGDQTSWHTYKARIVDTALTPDEALDAIVATSIYDFEYHGEGYQDADGCTARFTGFVGYDRHDWFLKNVGPQQVPALNEISILGYYALAFKALEARLMALEAA